MKRILPGLLAGLCLLVAGGMVSGVRASEMPEAGFVADEDVFELVLQVRRKGEMLSGALLGFQKGYTGYYLPMGGLLDMLEIYHETDLAAGTITGWFVNPGNPYALDAAQGTAFYGDQAFTLTPDAVMVRDFGAGFGDVYVRVDALNAILPLGLDLDFSRLELRVTADRSLPYELRRDREKRRVDILARRERREGMGRGFTPVDNPYRLYSPPVLDLSQTVKWSQADRTLEEDFTLVGKNDLLGFSADYGFNLAYRDNDLVTPDNLRMTLTRRAYGEETMPLGVRELRVGDISARTSDLINGANAGRGVGVSSAPLHRQGIFDEITVEGIATPGWDVELYRNGELLNYGTVDATGLYRFDDVTLLGGNNAIRIVLYGPAGQIEERTEDYRIGTNLLAAGEVEYEASVVDTNGPLVPLSGDAGSRAGGNNGGGLAYSGTVRAGVNRWMSAFATATDSVTRDGHGRYVTAGANLALGPALGNVEAYKELGGGRALDTRISANLFGWRARLRTEFMSDFESNRVGFGENAKVFDMQGNLSRRFATPLGRAGVTLSAGKEREKSGLETARYQVSNFLSRRKQNYGNRLTASYRDGVLTQMEGFSNATFRLGRNTRLRQSLNYDLQPHFAWTAYNADLDYRYSKNLNGGLNFGRILDTGENRIGTNVSYDFGKVLGILNADWRSERGVNVTLRASTSLAPYGENGAYIADSRSLREQSALDSRVFLDRNLNGVYDAADRPVEEAVLLVDQRETGASDAEGQVRDVVPGGGELAALSFSEGSGRNPFYAAEKKGYRLLLRSGIAQTVPFPLVETGGIDGVVTFENGAPVPGLRLHLVDAQDRTLKETITSYDGFFTFELVKPGPYVVRADPASGVSLLPRTVIIAPDSLFAYNTNMTLREKPASMVQVDAQVVRGHVSPIIEKLMALQNTLKGASAL